MSEERHETIEDIVCEMRALGRLDEKSTDKIPRSLQALGLRTGEGMKLEELSPEAFLLELYNPNGLWYLSDAMCMEDSSFGWCDASRLSVRPKSGEVALMVEFYDGTKFWRHADDQTITSIKHRIEMQKQRKVK